MENQQTDSSTEMLAEMLGKANSALDRAVTRIDELEKRLNQHADLVERVTQLEDAKWEAALDEAIELNAEAITAHGLNGAAFGGRDGKWQVRTLTDNPCLVGTGDRDLADALNDGWEIVHIAFAQSSVIFEGLPQHDYTRVVTLKKFVLSDPAPAPDPKQEAKEVALSALTPAPVESETVIDAEQPEPVVVQVLPGNMVIVDMLPDNLIVERPETVGMSYAEAIKNPFTTAEDLAAIHKRETEAHVSETLRQYRADGEVKPEWQVRVEKQYREAIDRWKNAPMPFEIRQPEFARK